MQTIVLRMQQLFEGANASRSFPAQSLLPVSQPSGYAPEKENMPTNPKRDSVVRFDFTSILLMRKTTPKRLVRTDHLSQTLDTLVSQDGGKYRTPRTEQASTLECVQELRLQVEKRRSKLLSKVPSRLETCHFLDLRRAHFCWRRR